MCIYIYIYIHMYIVVTITYYNILSYHLLEHDML